MVAITRFFHPKRWPLSRLLQLLIGGGILTSGLYEGDSGMVFIGGFFLALTLLNLGCGACRGNQCDI